MAKDSTENNMESKDLQDRSFNQYIRDKQRVSIYLANGIRLEGVIVEQDKYVIGLMGNDDQMSVVYKHAIATVLPSGSH